MTFSDFWTNENNPTLSQSEFLYGTRHLVVLAIVFVLCVVLTLVFRNKTENTKKKLFYVFGSIFLFFEVTLRIVNFIIASNITLESSLKIIIPMYICSVMVWVFIICIFSGNKVLTNFAMIGGLLATVSYLAYPAVGLNREFLSFTCIYSIASHSLGFICGILMITLNRAQLEYRKIWETYLCFGLMFLWGILLTFFIFPGSDYMYMVRDPLELNISFPYQIIYFFAIMTYVFIFYLFYNLIHKNKSIR